MKFTGFLPMHLIGYYKLNVDGATFANLQATGVGVLICDSAGKVEVALSKKRLIPLGPLEIKAKALEEGFHFAWDVGICEVILECDFKIVLEIVNGSSDPLMSIANIIEGIRLKLGDFRTVQVSHVNDKTIVLLIS